MSCADYDTNISLEQQFALVMDGIIDPGRCSSLTDGLPPHSGKYSQSCPVGLKAERQASEWVLFEEAKMQLFTAECFL